MTQTRRTWAEVSRNRLLHNYRHLRDLAGPQTELIAVVKANAYGHGLAECASILAGAGAQWLGVTCVEEGVVLRRVCPQAHILIMAGLCQGEAEAALEHNLTPVVWEPEHLHWLEAAARRRNSSVPIPLHLEIDTGMSRQGVALQRIAPFLDRLGSSASLRFEAVMTHFHSPDNVEATRDQEHSLVQAVEIIAERGLRPDYLSAGSSAAALCPESDAIAALARRIGARRMLRPGIALYGYPPSPGLEANLHPVLAWKTRVISLRDIEPGAVVGYDATFTARRTTRLALLPLGYADGFSRLLSNQGSVVVRGQRAPIAGRISMDHTVVDVTDILRVETGDEVVLIGEQGGERITAADMAQLRGTIPYEVLCDIAARVPRAVVDEPPC